MRLQAKHTPQWFYTAFVVVGMLVAVFAAEDREQTIRWDQLPEGVRARVSDSRDAVRRIVRAREDGATVYEVTTLDGGCDVETTYDGSGRLLELELSNRETEGK